MKKDPLQRDPTPYELLGVEPGADDAEIGAAAAAGGESEGETAANELRDPVQRSLVDLFLYQDRYLDDLAFDEPLQTLGETGARRRTDERWRAVEKRGFPMAGATHSLAVLSYWEARGSGRNGPDLPTPPDVTARLWEAALIRFAALCASEAFWTEWGAVTGNRGAGASAAVALERRLVDELETMARVRAEAGDVPGEGRVREHLALFRAELEAARQLPELRILSGRGLSPAAIAAGPYLLAEVDLLEKVRAAIDERRPDLLPLFTPVAFIARMVDEKEFGAALGALERLHADARTSPEARRIESRIHLEVGKQNLDADRLEEALGHWERAIATAETRPAAAVPISEAALGRAKLLHSREERDDAIELLQRVLPLGERSLIGVPLAHFLHERADDRIANAEAGSGEDATDLRPAIALMRGAVADLEEAVALDPSNGGIRDRRNEAEDLLTALLARAGPATPAPEPVAAAAPEEPEGPSAAPQAAPARRSSVLPAVGVALWLGVTLLALVVYPLIVSQRLGGTGTIVALVVAVGWIAANAAGWFLLR